MANASGYYDTQGTSGTGKVGAQFDTDSALFGGSTAAASAARNATWDTAKAQINEQTAARNAVQQTLANSQAGAERLAAQSGTSLADAYRALSAQQGNARDLLGSEAAAIRSSGQVDTSGMNQQRAAIAGLEGMAAGGPGPSGVGAAAQQARQQTLSQALASLNSGRGTAAAGAAQGAAMGQAAAQGAANAATAGNAAAAENQAFQARRLQALQAAGGAGANLQSNAQGITQQALAREQAAAGVMGAGDSLASQYQQLVANAQAAQAGNQMTLAQLEAANAGRDINSITTYGQQQGADMLAALGYRQQQLSQEDQLRVQGISSANATIAGAEAARAASAAKKEQANKASRDALIGSGLAIGAALL